MIGLMTEKTITFVVRVFNHNGGRLGFYIPKNVIEFYDLTGSERILESSSIKWKGGAETLPEPGTMLYKHQKNNIRGIIPMWSTMPDPGELVELTLILA